jgi:hypothetical protein
MNTRLQKILTVLMIAMAAVLFALQLRSLFIFPQPNSFRWFGDETWLMTEAVQQIATGLVRYPLAIGSTLEHGKGLALSMTWLSALLYGLPALIEGHNIVAVGRIVTAVFAMGLLALLYDCSRLLGASRFASALSILLLVCTRSFFFASHSARPDLLAGFIVLAFVALCTKFAQNGKEFGVWWWFGYGAVIVFLSISSSIHLLTLLGPVSLFFFWRLGGLRRWSVAVSAVAGACAMAAILIEVYYGTTGTLTLFSSSTGPAQFQDVLSSIPIRRPFSRSVQVANIIIRFKQFLSEAPEVFLLLVLLPFIWRRTSDVRHTFVIASFIVIVSWLLFEGAEINYLMHLLPLLFLGLAIAATGVIKRWNYAAIASFAGIAMLFFTCGFHDSSNALIAASGIDQSDYANIHAIEANIAANWHGNGKPRVLSEPIALDRLSQDTNLETMTDHFISFPLRPQPIDSFFTEEHVNYIVLYNSPVYPKNRERDDPFYQDIMRSGRLLASHLGTSGDMGRNYFGQSNWQDTLLLFQWPQ